MTLAWERRGVGRARAIDRRGGQNTDAASGRPLRASTGLSFFSRLPRAALPPQPSTTAASRRAAATRASARAGAPASEPPSLEKRGLSNVHFFAVKKAAVKTTIGRERLMHFKLHLAYGRCSRVLYLIHTGGGSPIANPIKHGTKLRCRGSPELHTLFPPCIAGYGPTLCSVCAQYRDMISNRKLTPCLRPEPHGNRNRGGDRDLGMLRAGPRARRASGPGARGVGVRYGNGLFPTHKSPNFILASPS